MKYIHRHTGRPIYTREVASERFEARQAATKEVVLGYAVAEGVGCWVRRRGEKRWRPHRTAQAHLFAAYLWRNEGWYGFELDGWEMKVVIGEVIEVRDPS